MTKEKIWLSSPHMGGSELDYIHQAFNENWIAPLGPNVDGFEEDLATYTGVKQAAALSSGTAAIHLALIILGVEPDDEVICQSMTFAASANPVKYIGANPVFVGSEPETWNMDPDLLEKAIEDRIQKKGKKPKAIIPVHLYGMPAKMKQIMKIADSYEIPVIEDAAEALGSSIGGQKAGSFGDLGVLSFNGNKIITTSGGGALLSDNERYIEKARFLATQARDEAPHYQHSEIGYNYRMSNISAGIGRGQMEVLEERIAARRANFDTYFNALGKTWLQAADIRRETEQKVFPRGEYSEGGRGVEAAPIDKEQPPLSPFIKGDSSTGIYFLKEPDGYFSNRWLTAIIVNEAETDGVTREDIRLALQNKNIEARPLWKPMHLQPVFKDAPFYGNGISEKLFDQGLCLPSGSNLNDEELNWVVNNIKNNI